MLDIARSGDLRAAKEACKSTSALQPLVLSVTDDEGRDLAQVALAHDHLKLAEHLGSQLVKLKKAEANRLAAEQKAVDAEAAKAAKAAAVKKKKTAKAEAKKAKAAAKQAEAETTRAAAHELAKAKVADKLLGNKAEYDAVVQRQKQEAKDRAQQRQAAERQAAEAQGQAAKIKAEIAKAGAKARRESEARARAAEAQAAREAAEDRATAKANALQEANKLIAIDTVKYHTRYTQECQKDGAMDQKNRLQALCRDIDGACTAKSGGAVPCNPSLGMDPASKAAPERTGYVKKLRKAMKSSVAGTDATLRGAATAAGCEFDEAALKKDKSNERLFQKAANCYGGNLAKVTDYKRRTLIAESFGSMENAIKQINRQLEIVRIKNRFDSDNKAAVETGGYRDAQLLVKIKGTELLLEVQLHIKGIHDLKTKVAGTKDANGQTGHERYIEFRNMKEAAELL